ncbi:hypothetical protein [Spirosoma pulveris]
MVVLHFTCSNPLAGLLESKVSGADLESCLDLFSTLVGLGWQPIEVTLLDDSEPAIELPVNAFDGVRMSEPIQSLQQQWQERLSDY